MAWLVDTCALSESTRPKPDARVAAFMDRLDWDQTYISVISLGEIWKGIQKLPTSRRRDELQRWLTHTLVPSLVNPPLPIDLDVAFRWGKLRAALDDQGNMKPTLDCLLAATALVYDLTIVTRNERDFLHTGVQVFNPWR
jgi:toxin FitB